MVLFLFLRSWKTTLIIGIAIPISVVTTFFLMYVFGDLAQHHVARRADAGNRPAGGQLDRGARSDPAPARRRRGRGRRRRWRGASEVARAVIASTLTTICVFVPIVFVEGIAGQLFGDQALTVTFSLVISLLVALTVIPMLASRDFRPRAREDGSGEEPKRWLLARWGQAAIFLVSVFLARIVRGAVFAVGTALNWLTAVPLRLFHGGFDVLAAAYSRLLGQVPAPPARNHDARGRRPGGQPHPLSGAGQGARARTGPGRVLRQHRVAAGHAPRHHPASDGGAGALCRRPRRRDDGLLDLRSVQRAGRSGRTASREHRPADADGGPSDLARSRGRTDGRAARGAGPPGRDGVPLRTSGALLLQDSDRDRDPRLQPEPARAAGRRAGRADARHSGTHRHQELDRGGKPRTADPFRPCQRLANARAWASADVASALRVEGAGQRGHATSSARTARSTFACVPDEEFATASRTCCASTVSSRVGQDRHSAVRRGPAIDEVEGPAEIRRAEGERVAP